MITLIIILNLWAFLNIYLAYKSGDVGNWVITDGLFLTYARWLPIWFAFVIDIILIIFLCVDYLP